jgi:hypothetical protein
MDAEILKRKSYSDHPADDYLEIVLAKIGWGVHPYVTWGFNHESGGYFLGHYFETLEEAEKDFERR